MPNKPLSGRARSAHAQRLVRRGQALFDPGDDDDVVGLFPPRAALRIMPLPTGPSVRSAQERPSRKPKAACEQPWAVALARGPWLAGRRVLHPQLALRDNAHKKHAAPRRRRGACSLCERQREAHFPGHAGLVVSIATSEQRPRASSVPKRVCGVGRSRAKTRRSPRGVL